MSDHKEGNQLDRGSIQESDIRAALTRILGSAEFSPSKRAGSELM